MSENRQLTAEEHDLVYRLRCVLQDWGLPADEIPAAVLLSHSGLKVAWECGPYGIGTSATDTIHLYHNEKPFVLDNHVIDPYGVLVCCRVGTRPTRVLRPDLMPLIWQQAHKVTA